MLSDLIQMESNGPDELPPPKLGWTESAFAWDVRMWIAGKLERWLDRLYGVTAPASPLTFAPPPPAEDMSLDVGSALGPPPLVMLPQQSSPPPLDPVAAAAITLNDQRFATEVAGMCDVSFDEVWERLGELPPNMATMLDTPQGQTAVAHMLALHFGAAAIEPLCPAVH